MFDSHPKNLNSAFKFSWHSFIGRVVVSAVIDHQRDRHGPGSKPTDD